MGYLHFSENLAALRKREGLSQADIAEILEIKRTTYANYENGTTEPPYQLLIKISLFYKVSIDALLTELLVFKEKVLVEEPQPKYTIDHPRVDKEVLDRIEQLFKEFQSLMGKIIKE